MSVSLSKVAVFPMLSAQDANKVKREKLGENQTSSLEDPAFEAFRGHALTPNEQTTLANWSNRLELSKHTIKQHLEKRVMHLFLQATVCYRSRLVFEEGHTIHQGLGAHPIGAVKFQAAHSATLPCLYATSLATGQKFVYLYRSGYYDEANATIDVVNDVNDADRAIDEKYTDSLLRDKAVGLLNRASNGEITPEHVSELFAQDLIVEIEKAINGRSTNQVKDVLQIYLKKARKLVDYVKVKDNIDFWLNLQLDDPMLTEVTEIIDKIEQNEEVPAGQIQQLLKQKIDELPAVIMQRRHQQRNERAPCHFYDLFYKEVLSHFTGEDLKHVEAALGLDYDKLKAKAIQFDYTISTNAILLQNRDVIQKLVKELHPFLAAIQKKEVQEPLVGLSPEKKVVLRPAIHRLRYEIIRQDQEAQSRIKAKIESVFNAVKGARAPAHFSSFFYKALLTHEKVDASVKLKFCKLLNVSGFSLNQAVRELKVNKNVHDLLEEYAREMLYICTAIHVAAGDRNQQPELKVRIEAMYNQLAAAKNVDRSQLRRLYHKRLFEAVESPLEKIYVAELLGQNESELDALITASQKEHPAETKLLAEAAKVTEAVTLALAEMKELNEKTFEYRRKLMVELRLSHGMNQNHFKAVYKQIYQHFPMSDGTMSNLENGLKKIEGPLLGHLSRIFGVHSSLFSPAHFAEI